MDPAKVRAALRKQGIEISAADPILDVAAICEAALSDAVKQIAEITRQQTDRVTIASTQAVVDAEKRGERLIGDAAAFVEARIKVAAEEAARLYLVRLELAADRSEQASAAARRAMQVTAAAGVMTGCVLIGILAAAIW